MSICPVVNKAVFNLNYKVLEVLGSCDEDFPFCYNFSGIQRKLGVDRLFIKAACQHLRNMGLATYERGLFTEGGEMAGAGYAITKKGREFLTTHGSLEEYYG